RRGVAADDPAKGVAGHVPNGANPALGRAGVGLDAGGVARGEHPAQVEASLDLRVSAFDERVALLLAHPDLGARDRQKALFRTGEVAWGRSLIAAEQLAFGRRAASRGPAPLAVAHAVLRLLVATRAQLHAAPAIAERGVQRVRLIRAAQQAHGQNASRQKKGTARPAGPFMVAAHGTEAQPTTKAVWVDLRSSPRSLPSRASGAGRGRDRHRPDARLGGSARRAVQRRHAATAGCA